MRALIIACGISGILLVATGAILSQHAVAGWPAAATAGAIALVGCTGLIAREQLDRRVIRSERQAHLRQLLRHWPLKRIHDVPLIGTGVFPSAIADSYIGTDGVEPPYVQLDHHGELVAAVGSASFVVVIGEPKTGKSRAAWEAARAACAAWWMLAPVEGVNLRELLSLNPFQELPPGEPVLVWLDDLDSYLGVNGLDDALLQDMVTTHRRITMLCTIRAAAHEQKSMSGGAERVLARARRKGGAEFHLAQENTYEELARARRAYPGLAFKVSIGYELVAWDELIWKFRLGEDSPGGALVRAAADWRRLGLTRPIEIATLRALASGYTRGAALSNQTVYQDAVSWATAPISSSAALLVTDGVETGYRADDLIVSALDGRVQGQRDLATPIADHTWLIATAHVSREEQVELGRTARLRQLWSTAEQILVQAMKEDSPAPIAAGRRGLRGFHRTPGVDEAYLTATAALELSLVRSHLGNAEGARAAVARALTVGVIDPSGARLTTMLDSYDAAVRSQDQRVIEKVHADLASVIETRGYETFTLSEIHEQADAVRETLKEGFADGRASKTRKGEDSGVPLITRARRIVVVGCGSSYLAGLMGRYVIEAWARVPVETAIASEYRYSQPMISDNDVVIALSQSGETADTLAAMRLARQRGAKILAITNVVGSQATRESDGVVFTRAGIEIGVAATKTFAAQVAMMYVLALRLGELRGTLQGKRLVELSTEIQRLPQYIDELLATVTNAVSEIVTVTAQSDFFLYTGRNIGLPVALEGAHKLSEFAYLANDAYAGGEIRHGALMQIKQGTPTVCVATDSPLREAVLSDMCDVKTRGARVIAIVTEGDDQAARLADHVICVPRTEWMIQALLAVIPLQLLAYDIARWRGLNIDQPRHLAKTVTVE